MTTRSFERASRIRHTMQQLIDLTEVAEILDVSRERADELAEGIIFPPSVGDRGGERLWRRADVELWARAIRTGACFSPFDHDTGTTVSDPREEPSAAARHRRGTRRDPARP
jgi:hypothetical protein